VTDDLYRNSYDKAFKSILSTLSSVNGVPLAAPYSYTLALEGGLTIEYYSGLETKKPDLSSDRPRKINVKGNPFGAELMQRR